MFACGLHSSKEDKVGIYDMSAVVEPSKDFDKKKLKAKLELGAKSHVHSIVWEDQEYAEGFKSKELIIGEAEQAVLWDLETGRQKGQIPSDPLGGECFAVKRDPHHKSVICIGVEKGFHQVDLRTSASQSTQPLAHSDTITDLDYNPNKLNTLATCGRDSVLRFWDLRKTDRCLL